MHSPELLTELVLLIAIAAAGVALFERFDLPGVAGFLLMGAIVGPGGVGLVRDADAVRSLAEFGVVFLLFEIGLELPIQRLRESYRVALVAGGLQVGGTLAVVAFSAGALGVEPRSAVVLGALVAMSSTAVVMRLLADRGEIDAPHGQLTVGVLLFQDLCIVPFLLAVPVLAAPGPIETGPILLAFGRAGLAIVVFFGVAWFALPRVLDAVARTRSRDLFSLISVLVVAGAALAAERIGLTLAVGAFLAGLVARSSAYGDQLFAEVLPLRGVLLGIFFTAVGMLLDLGAALERPFELLFLLVAAVVVKAAVGVATLAALRQGLGAALRSGLMLAQTGEFSFILAAAAATAGLLDAGLHQSFIAASVLSLIATPFLARFGSRLAAAASQGAEVWTESSRGPSGHVVLVGYGMAGRNLARILRAIDVEYVAIEANAATVSEARGRGEAVVYGDAMRTALLERVGVQRARAVAVAVNDPVATRQVVEAARSLNPDAAILARTRYVLDVDRLNLSGADVVVAEELEATIDLVSEALRIFGIPKGSIASFAAELRDEGYEQLRMPPALALDPWLAELLERVSTEWVEAPDGLGAGVTLAELDLRARAGSNLLAVDRGGVTTPNPQPDFEILPGDRLLVFGGAQALARTREILGIPSEDV